MPYMKWIIPSIVVIILLFWLSRFLSCNHNTSQNDKIVKDVDGSIGKKILNDVFKEWFQNLSNNRRPPKLAELEEILNNTFGNRNVKTNKWHGIRINYDDETDDPIDNL